MIRFLKKLVTHLRKKKEPQILVLAQQLVKTVKEAEGLDKAPLGVIIWNHAEPEKSNLIAVEIAGDNRRFSFKGGAVK